MNTIEFFDSGKVVRVPVAWSEMTPRQVQGVFRLFERGLRLGWSPLEFNVRVMWMLLGVRRTLRGRIADIFDGKRATFRHSDPDRTSGGASERWNGLVPGRVGDGDIRP